MAPPSFSPVTALVLSLALASLRTSTCTYTDALEKSLLFFEGQRAGSLPKDQRVTWRKSSALSDGRDVKADLSKGYFDAGDNVKFVLPMSFTLTMLAWGIVDFGTQLDSVGQLNHALDALRWGTDFLLNAHPQPNMFHAGVGDGDTDHKCWMRPEDMTTDRTTYTLTADKPGSDAAGEAAAALAAASIAFKSADARYSSQLVESAKSLFTFANTYRGLYHDSIPNVKEFYTSSRYTDELLWAGAWLYRATQGATYLDFLVENGESFGGTNKLEIAFSWDNKLVGAQVLVASMVHKGDTNAAKLQGYTKTASDFACTFVHAKQTPGGLVFIDSWGSLQYITSGSLALLALADSLGSETLTCSGKPTSSADVVNFVKSQMDYILGKNPRGMSYMVGYGAAYPKHIHHRAASLPSLDTTPAGKLSCLDGWKWYTTTNPNPQDLVGALVGGPDNEDGFTDVRGGYHGNEPTTYANGPVPGVLARLAQG